MKVYKFLTILIIAVLCIMCTQIISNAQTATVITETLRLRKEATTDSKILELISEDEKVEVLESGLGNDNQWYKVKYKDNEGDYITGYVYGEFIKLDGSNTTSKVENNTTKNENTTTNVINENANTVEPKEENVVNETNTVEENIITNETTINNTVEENVVSEPEGANGVQETIETIEINTDKTVNVDTDMYIIPLINASKIHTITQGETLHVLQVLNGWAYVSKENISGWVRCSNLT